MVALLCDGGVCASVLASCPHRASTAASSGARHTVQPLLTPGTGVAAASPRSLRDSFDQRAVVVLHFHNVPGVSSLHHTRTALLEQTCSGVDLHHDVDDILRCQCIEKMDEVLELDELAERTAERPSQREKNGDASGDKRGKNLDLKSTRKRARMGAGDPRRSGRRH